MKRILIVGIGAGDPDHLTLQAVKAIAAADVFFILDKGEAGHDLIRLRQDLVDAHARAPYRLVKARDPDRDRTSAAYATAVQDWRSRRAGVYERLIRDELGDDETGAFLVWGDPSLYDSTPAVLEEVLDRGAVRFVYDVVPGISSVSALAARHRIGLTRIARPLHITTGRRLALEVPEADDIVVMLDARCAFATLPDAAEFEIYWGAYLGTPDEILVAGAVTEVAGQIRDVRAAARERKGWIMDTYLLRRVSR
ncbi:precorrin-6A synthase (deacetylating) [Streptosporangium lutulentum]|uniref:Precorrin-6A synthase n=1 Tax=Streptosporangium lutulentum TaxID=1461250 RepID=A0ABT9QBS5_9ACTN|nr:precorrin-6A synthase (deacetylating) [Streptosporangium lutulentum]MDP9844227.1 precorrin-6A synthase [Streptosporangium lutulentum]